VSNARYFLNNYRLDQKVSVAFDLEYPYQLLYDANYVDINNWPTSSFDDYYRPQDSSSYATQNSTFQLKFDGDTQNIKTSINGIWASDTISVSFGVVQKHDFPSNFSNLLINLRPPMTTADLDWYREETASKIRQQFLRTLDAWGCL
jgi:hypothetical protein